VTAFFCGAVFWAFVTVGTPGAARNRHIDQARVRDLQEIHWEIGRFFREEKRLPNDLKELTLDSERLVDPVTKTPYEYIVKDTQNYQLAAEFALSDEDGDYPRDRDWRHGSGLHHFSFKVEPETAP
jgi:hypothetical protein